MRMRMGSRWPIMSRVQHSVASSFPSGGRHCPKLGRDEMVRRACAISRDHRPCETGPWRNVREQNDHHGGHEHAVQNRQVLP